jgi:hypothetical protein
MSSARTPCVDDRIDEHPASIASCEEVLGDDPEFARCLWVEER